MDILQIFGDYIHLLGMSILLMKLWLTRTCAGVSGKTQLLNAIVVTARYTDLTTYFLLYLTIMKIIYISITYCTVLLIFYFFRKTYDRERDTFRIELLIIPCTVLGIFFTNYLETVEVFRTFSLFLEAVSIVPQVYMVSKSKQVESTVVSYIACLGLYRGFYLMHWLYIYLKLGVFHNASVASGIIQVILYCDFLARNLPILKYKNCSQDADFTTREEVKGLELTGSNFVEVAVDQRGASGDMHAVVVTTASYIDAVEKVGLLASNVQRQSE